MDGINIDRFSRGLTDNIEAPVRKHLKNVYACFTMSTISAGLGGYCDMYSTMIQSGILSALGAIGLLIWLMMTPYDGKNQKQRLAMLGGFSFLTGVNIGPLLQFAYIIDPSLIVQALLGTAVVFACFSLASLYAPRGHYLYLGGTLLSGLSILFWLSMLNIFFNSRLIFQANIYVGLVIMCGFVVYDTQAIMEKARLGDKDYVMHSIDLFIDFVSIFKRLLVILMDKEGQSKRKKKSN